MHEALQPGDKVIWWKRMAGGDYVSPVQATVLALTAKRVQIEADDGLLPTAMRESRFSMAYSHPY